VLAVVSHAGRVAQDFLFGAEDGFRRIARRGRIERHGVRMRQNFPRQFLPRRRVPDMAVDDAPEIAGRKGGPMLRHEVQHGGGITILDSGS
jgi:hypothetical protein